MESDMGDNITSICQHSKDLIPADLRIAVYGTCMLNYGEEVYGRLLQVTLADS